MGEQVAGMIIVAFPDINEIRVIDLLTLRSVIAPGERLWSRS